MLGRALPKLNCVPRHVPTSSSPKSEPSRACVNKPYVLVAGICPGNLQKPWSRPYSIHPVQQWTFALNILLPEVSCLTFNIVQVTPEKHVIPQWAKYVHANAPSTEQPRNIQTKPNTPNSVSEKASRAFRLEKDSFFVEIFNCFHRLPCGTLPV